MSNNQSMIPLQKTRLHEGIVELLRNRILSGGIAAGEKIPTERELAESLAVNRTTVREALKNWRCSGL